MALSKRETQSSTVLIAGGGERIKAGVAQENISHIIARLTKLYDNPVEAALREVFSNALDATLLLPEVERQPVVISSPTIFEPVLTVEDFAGGMSLDDVREIYANYGVSTKSENLNAVGSYGLGGKAPLAYSDNFTVETTKDGITTVFIMQRINGEVETEIISSEETGCDSGTRVSIPVQKDDTERFAKAIAVYKNFSWGHPVEIDGEIFQGAEDYVSVGKALIYQDPDTEIHGEARVLRSKIAEIFNSISNSGTTRGLLDVMDFELGSWVYGAQGDRYSGTRKPIVVSIVPTLVEFSSARDAITEDDRLRELQQHVQLSLFQKDFFEALFKIFRGLSTEEIKEFSKTLNGSAIKVKQSKLVLESYYSSRSFFEGDLSLMDAECGINPYYLRGSNVEPSVKLAFGWTWMNGLRLCKAERQSLFSSSINEESVSKLSSLYEEFNKPAARATSYYATALYSGSEKLMLVTATTEQEFRTLVRRREALQAHFDDETIFAFSTLTLAAQDEKDLQYCEKILGDRFSTIEAAELLEELEDTRKSLAKERKNDRSAKEIESLEASFRAIKLAVDFSKPTEVIKVNMQKNENWHTEYISLKDFSETDAVLILGGWYSWSSIYIGAVNAEEPIIGKQIYFIDSDFDATQWRFLKEFKERVYISTNHRARLKVTREFMAERGFNGTTLNSVLSNFPEQDLIKSCLRSLSSLKKKPLEEVQKRLTAEDSTLKRYVALTLEAKTTEGEYISEGEAFAEMERRGINVGELKSFREAARKLTYGYSSADDQFMASVMSAVEIPVGSDSPIVSYILDHATAKLRRSFNA